MGLSLNADVSTRHISFLETGRSSPTRAMVARLAEAMDLKAHEAAELARAAGFWAPPRNAGDAYTEGQGLASSGMDDVLAIDAAATPEAACDIAAALFSKLGLTQFFTGTLEQAGGGSAPLITHQNLMHAPLGWMSHYRERNFVRIDPLVRETASRHLPFFWSDLFPEDGPRCRQVRRMLREAGEFSVSNGFVMAIHRSDGKVHAVSAMAQDLATRDPRLRAAARTISVALLCRLDEIGLRDTAAELQLTRAERDMLAYILDGRSVRTFAARTGVDEGAAQRMMSRLCNSLGTSDPLEASLRARRLGLVATS